ncbi:MAG: alkaline phosphatase, partial [Gemmatimonadales bacterium]
MNRRDLLKAGALAGAAAAAAHLPGLGALRAARAATAGPAASARLRESRNLIFLVLDGTGYEDMAAASMFSRRVLGRPLLLEQVLSAGQYGSMDVQSLTAVVTDSAAATSAWATGRRVVNGALSQLPDGRDLTTILQVAKDQGRATGLVTTTRMTHATPAGWVARVAARGMEEEIAEQYLAFRPDILMGGGRGPFEAETRSDGRDLTAEFRDAGYEVIHDQEGLEAASGDHLLGLFTNSDLHLPYEADRRFQDVPSPSLAAMTRKALRHLGDREGGFVLQVEAGRIDHANHRSDLGAALWDWIAADEALNEILSFLEVQNDTILIVAADHDTGGGAVYGFGSGYRSSTPAFETLGGVRASHEWLFREIIAPGVSPGDIQDAVREYLGVMVPDANAEIMARVVAGERGNREVQRGHPNAHRSQPGNTLAKLITISPDGAPDRPNVSFSTSHHTAGLVPVAVVGPSVAPGSLGFVENTELFHIMCAALGTRFENP